MVNTIVLPLLIFGWWESLSAIRPVRTNDVVAATPPATLVPAYEFRIEGNHITIRADETPLKTVLADFVRAGIKVKFDPGIEATVTGYEKNLPIDKALEKLLGPFGYVLIWSVVPGPLGDIERLDEVHVFRRDGPRTLEDFPLDENFRITRGPLPDSPEFVADEILIAFKPGTDIDQFRVLLAQIGGSVIESLPDLGIYRLRVPANANILALVDGLKAHPIVSRVEPNYAYRMPRAMEGAARASPTAARGATKPGERTPAIAVLDSGLRAMASLDGLVAGSFDAVRPERAIDDTAGHGTQMALIASGAVPPAGTTGSATGVPVVGIRAFDDNGVTSNFTLMRALEYADAQGARVINMSWGSNTSSAFMEAAVRDVLDEGMILVAAAGNEPTGRPVYPAAYDGVISVSALNEDGSPWAQSNFGSSVDIAAPGTALLPVGYEGPPGGYAGTSIASAYVARSIALYLANHPGATADEARQALVASLSDVDTQYGRGALDDAAIQRLLK